MLTIELRMADKFWAHNPISVWTHVFLVSILTPTPKHTPIRCLIMISNQKLLQILTSVRSPWLSSVQIGIPTSILNITCNTEPFQSAVGWSSHLYKGSSKVPNPCCKLTCSPHSQNTCFILNLQLLSLTWWISFTNIAGTRNMGRNL